MRVSRMLSDSGRLKPVQWRAGRIPDPPSKPSFADVSQPEEAILALETHIRELTASAEQQCRAAYDEGYRAGEAAGRAAAETDVNAAVTKLCSVIADVLETRDDITRRAEADTVRLAVAIARRILHRELTTDTSALETLIRAALEKLQSQEVYRVRVHPDLAVVMRGCLEQVGREGAVEVIKDPVQPKGGAVFEISRGNLDASVETQLREIERSLNERLEEGS